MTLDKQLDYFSSSSFFFLAFKVLSIPWHFYTCTQWSYPALSHSQSLFKILHHISLLTSSFHILYLFLIHWVEWVLPYMCAWSSTGAWETCNGYNSRENWRSLSQRPSSPIASPQSMSAKEHPFYAGTFEN